MRIPNLSARWPVYLAIAGLVIVVASVWYTQRLANQLEEIDRRNVELYVTAVERLNQMTEAEMAGDTTVYYDDVTMELAILENTVSVPMIMTNRRGGIDDAIGFGDRSADSLYLSQTLQGWIRDDRRPLVMDSQVVYMGESWLVRQLRWFPGVQLLLISAFVGLGFLGISQTRRAEQNRVWVGLAKETAHQLGTPISAILGWVEHLKLMYADDEDINEITTELTYDVERLSMVANRFSKIGATPELEVVNVYAELDKCRDYMQKRAPRKVSFDFPAADAGDARVALNPLLFDWVFENLLRNALDAMDGRGNLSGSVRETASRVMIDITDTGKGIAAKNIRKVFNPGFTTKKRGWGLGLSLVKRIVEEYHNGKIAVSHSEVGKGTTFTITLPRAA